MGHAYVRKRRPIRLMLIDNTDLSGRWPADPDIDVVGEFPSMYQAWHHIRADRPDVVMLSVKSSQWLEYAGRVKNLPATRLILLAPPEETEQLLVALSVGAEGYCDSLYEAAFLPDIIKTVHGGGAFMSPRIAHSIQKLFFDQAG